MQKENGFKNVIILEKWEDLKSGQIGHFVTATVSQKSLKIAYFESELQSTKNMTLDTNC